MPRKDGKFTPQEQVFVERMASTGDATYAAEKAGYGTPARRASQALANPAIVDEIRRLQTQRLHAEVLPLAVDAHLALLRDPMTPAGARGVAIGLAYKYGLAGADEYEKEPSEMSAEELATAIRNLEHLKAARAKPIIEGEATASVFE